MKDRKKILARAANLTLFPWRDLKQSEKIIRKLYIRRNDARLWEAARWVDAPEFVGAFLYTFAQRISELRKMGFDIEGRRVEGKKYFKYRLKGINGTES